MAALLRADPDVSAGTARRPLIGVSAWIQDAKWQGFGALATLVEYSFVRKLRSCGASVIVIPPTPDDAAVIVDLIDGLVLSGGEDVDPDLYGAPAPADATIAPRERDEGDLALTRGALSRDLPVLAVCRGCQVLNVARGGTLVPHLPDVTEQVHQAPRDDPGGPFARHSVTADSPLLADLLGDRFEVQSSHHQAVAELGRDLEPAARAEDGNIEAIWDPAQRFVLGVQWHPEVEEGYELFHGIVDAAAERLAAGDTSGGAAAR